MATELLPLAYKEEGVETIKCSKCPKLYLKNKEMSETYFGYNRLMEPYRTCMKCREYVRKCDAEKREKGPTYWKEYYREII